MIEMDTGKTLTWSVVQFEADDTVEAVPTTWINGDLCLWPPFTQNKTTNAIKNCEISTHWPSHKVRIFKDATFDDYMLARKKAKKAEVTSDLNSDIDNKRKKRKVVLSSSDDEDDPISYVTKKLPTPPRKKPIIFEQLPTPCTNKEQSPHDNLGFTPMSPSESFSRKDTPRSSVSNNVCTKSCICCARNVELNKTLFIIKSINCEILEKVNCLIQRKETSAPDEINLLNQVGVQYPISSIEELETFEHFFLDEKKYMWLVNFFAKIGGSNVSEYAKRCLAPIISDRLAEQFSFIGRKEKKNFSILTLAKAVLDGADKMDKSRKDYESAIAAWLKRAKARLDRQK